MQLSKKEEPFNFDQLEKKLKEAPFSSLRGRELLLKLIEEPAIKLSNEDEKNYGALQANLRNNDLEVRQLTVIAIGLTILNDTAVGKKIAERISEEIIKQRADALHLDGTSINSLDSFNWSALCNLLKTLKITSLDLGSNNLAYLSERQWQDLESVLQESNITSLNLSVTTINNLDLRRWQVLCSALQTSKITSFKASHNILGKLNATKWQAFCNVLQTSKITFLDLTDNYLEKLDYAEWQAFCNALQASNITSLILNRNNLGLLDQIRWQAFCTALQNSKITSLDLRDNNLEALDRTKRQAFYSVLQTSKITSLNLSRNDLGLFNLADWQSFCKELQTSKINTLHLHGINLGQISQAHWQAFGDSLNRSNITSLYLGNNFIGYDDQAHLQAFLAFLMNLPNSKITSLALNDNKLGRLDRANWKIFCESLSPKITSLDLSDNHIGQLLDQEMWQVFCNAIATSNINLLNVNRNYLRSTHWQKLAAVMDENINLTLQIPEQGTIDEWPPELAAINERNRFLQQTSQSAQELINSKQNEKDYQTQLDKTLTCLNKSLSILYDKDTPRSNTLRTKLQNYLEDLQWKKGCWYRDQAFAKKDSSAEKLLNEARDIWLSISFKSKHFEEARHQIFQLVYNDVFTHSKAHGALIEALPYLVGEENQLINLNKENQMVFDNYLFAAAGGKEAGLNKEFTPEQRLALLQYILLLEIKQSCEQKDDTGKADTQFFKTERLAGLLDSLKDLSLDPKNLDEDAQDNLNDLWVKTYDRLQKMPLSDNNTNVLIEAINHLKFPTPKLDSKPGV